MFLFYFRWKIYIFSDDFWKRRFASIFHTAIHFEFLYDEMYDDEMKCIMK